MSLKAAERLRAEATRILNEWALAVRLEIPPAGGLDEAGLLGSAAAIIEGMADEILDGEPGANKAACRKHGEARAGISEFQLHHLITEYRILRRAILQSLDGLGREDLDAILGAIDDGIAESALEFTNRRMGNIRSESTEREKFVSILSHDLRNPMTAIRSAVELLKRRDLPPELRQRLLDQISESVARTQRMVEDLLDANRIRAGKGIQPRLLPLVLNDLVNQVVSEQRLVHGDRFNVETEEEIRGMWCPDGLRRLLENLLTNAIKHGKPGAPVTLKLRQVPPMVEIHVHNHVRERPLSADERAMLFQPFSRGKIQDGASSNKGWGLGLTLVRGVADAHHGSVRVESSMNDGTSFIVTLPLDPAQKGKRAA